MNSNEGTTEYGVTLVERIGQREIIREPAFLNHGVWDRDLCRWVPGYNVWTDKRTIDECRTVARRFTNKRDNCLGECKGCLIEDECPVNPSGRKS